MVCNYAEDGNVAALSEDPGVDLGAQGAHFFAAGALAQGWRLARRARWRQLLLHESCRSENASVTITAVDHEAQEGRLGDTNGALLVRQASRS
jgi:hypothetical protein